MQTTSMQVCLSVKDKQVVDIRRVGVHFCGLHYFIPPLPLHKRDASLIIRIPIAIIQLTVDAFRGMWKWEGECDIALSKCCKNTKSQIFLLIKYWWILVHIILILKILSQCWEIFDDILRLQEWLTMLLFWLMKFLNLQCMSIKIQTRFTHNV